jgi:hypothetical protein
LVCGTIDGRATLEGAVSAGAADGAGVAAGGDAGGAAFCALAARVAALIKNAAATAVEKCLFMAIIPKKVALVSPA